MSVCGLGNRWLVATGAMTIHPRVAHRLAKKSQRLPGATRFNRFAVAKEWKPSMQVRKTLKTCSADPLGECMQANGNGCRTISKISDASSFNRSDIKWAVVAGTAEDVEEEVVTGIKGIVHCG
jgi:hypothetical protein